MSVEIQRGLKVLSNGSGVRSESVGNIQILYDDTFFQLTNDGDTFTDGFIFLDATGLFIGSGTTSFDLNKDCDSQLSCAADNEIRFNPSNTNIFSLVRTAGGLNKIRMDIPTFADNAAALAGGLAIQDIYKIAGGDLQIVV